VSRQQKVSQDESNQSMSTLLMVYLT
jgi:hypothetical protein